MAEHKGVDSVESDFSDIEIVSPFGSPTACSIANRAAKHTQAADNKQHGPGPPACAGWTTKAERGKNSGRESSVDREF